MNAAVLAAIESEVSRWEWQQRLAQRPSVDLGVDAAALLDDVRTPDPLRCPVALSGE